MIHRACVLLGPGKSPYVPHVGVQRLFTCPKLRQLDAIR